MQFRGKEERTTSSITRLISLSDDSGEKDVKKANTCPFRDIEHWCLTPNHDLFKME